MSIHRLLVPHHKRVSYVGAAMPGNRVEPSADAEALGVAMLYLLALVRRSLNGQGKWV